MVSSAGVAPCKGKPLLYRLRVKPLLLEPAYRLQASRNFHDDKPLPRASLASFLLGEAGHPRFCRQVMVMSG